MTYYPSHTHPLNKSSCSSYLFSTNIDIVTNYQYVQPCPALLPCQCLCDIENKNLWIDCFNRKIKSLPILETIPTNNSIIEWNIDLSFNLFDNLTNSKWIPTNMHIGQLIFSGSLSYDLVLQLNLIHRHLIDTLPYQQHLPIINDDNQQDRFFDDYHDDDDIEEKHKYTPDESYNEYMRLLNELTLRLRDDTEQIKIFALSLAGEPSSVSILYLDHNSLDSIPIEALYNATSLYELYLSYNNINNLPAYAFGFSHRLTRIDLSYNQISSIDILTFQRHPNAFAGPFLIDHLDLSHNEITILEPNIFSYLVNLRFLKLKHNRIYSLSAQLWTGLYRLKYLDLSHNSIGNFTKAFYSSYLNELKYLKMTSNNINLVNSCEFLSLRALNKLYLSGNNLSSVDTCAFYGLSHKIAHSPVHIYLHSNHFETLDPCTFINFTHSTIHVENNPLICNCSFNYLLHARKSLVYTGQECRGGFAYKPQTKLTSPAIHKIHKAKGNKIVNNSITCRNTFRYYNNLCWKLDCPRICSTNERFIIQITTIATPSKTISKFQKAYFLIFFILLYTIFEEKIY
ncbi:unnamed protein product [Rotaria socialis]|uniref:Uncharacterized protein n=1 Tax=Rotaria socialis TaxID=392032 RepID=A0A818J330_9BILA|nr:unnamed protein product [Rotaria socialis]CAF4792464.1 unnamed protein product [Rotaria socialis]